VQGELPLHAAAANEAPVEAVELRLDRFPGAVREKADWGTLPLHRAAKHRAPVEVTRCRTEAWVGPSRTGPLRAAPGAPRRRTGSVDTVECLSNRCPETLQIGDNDGAFALHRDLICRALRQAIRYLVRKWEREKSTYGWLQLTCAVNRRPLAVEGCRVGSVDWLSYLCIPFSLYLHL
jgi:hypothetical protein